MLTIPIPAENVAAKAAAEGREEVEAEADVDMDPIDGIVDENAAVSIELAATVCVE